MTYFTKFEEVFGINESIEFMVYCTKYKWGGDCYVGRFIYASEDHHNEAIRNNAVDRN